MKRRLKHLDKLSNLISQGSKSAPFYSPEEAQRITAKMRVDTYNSTDGQLTSYDCAKCKNRGAVAVLCEDSNGCYMQVRDCSCMKIRRCVWKMEKSGLCEIIRDCAFDAFLCANHWTRSSKVDGRLDPTMENDLMNTQ